MISGDATPKSDVLMHEVYTQASFEKVPPERRQYRQAFHTSLRELAEIANKAKPQLLILYHTVGRAVALIFALPR